MNCPVCNRENTNSLSICPSCGAMIFDSVREELRNKITPLSKPKPIPIPEITETPAIEFEIVEEALIEETFDDHLRGNLIVQNQLKPERETVPQEIEAINIKPMKNEIAIEEAPRAENLKLVEFRTEPVEMPEWRLRVQNIARQRLNRHQDSTAMDETPARRSRFATKGATALKVEEVEEVQKVEETQYGKIDNPLLLKALKRIEKSRNRHYEEPPAPRKAYLDNPQNLYIAAKANQILPKPEGVKARVNAPVRPKSARNNFKKENSKPNRPSSFLKPAEISTSFDKRPIIPEYVEPEIKETTLRENPVVRESEVAVKELVEREDLIVQETDVEYARLITPEETVASEVIIEHAKEIEYQEIEDCAPFALRFNAGLFDMIIGSSLSLFLLAPFMLLGGEWFTLSGFLAFVATCSIVMFIYLTTAIGLFGRTFGMRLFSLEVVDIEGENYPTLHQAAVSSSVYLLSLALGGIGFLTLLTNPEKRAVHDLASGTIVVKEF